MECPESELQYEEEQSATTTSPLPIIALSVAILGALLAVAVILTSPEEGKAVSLSVAAAMVVIGGLFGSVCLGKKKESLE